jgi:hypothetical protein
VDRNLSTPPTRARRPIGRLFTTGLALSVVLGGTSAAFSAHAAALPVSANLPVTAPPKAATGPGSLGHQDGARIDPVPVAAHRYPGPSGRSGPAADSTPDITPLPAQVDLSQWDVPPGQQGAVGSCAAWAIDYSMAGWYADRLGRPTLFAPMYAYSQVHYDDSSSGGGTWPDRVYAIGEQQGIDTQADYSQGSFDFADPPTPAEQANAALYKMTPFATLYNNGGEANAPVTKPGSGIRTDLESTLAAQHPVALSIPAFIPMYQLTTRSSRSGTTRPASGSRTSGGPAGPPPATASSAGTSSRPTSRRRPT